MTEKELKKYALIGLLVRITAEEEKYNKAKTETRRQEIKSRIDEMKKQYNSIINELPLV